MSGMINFGIDLGTTNSLVAKFDKGVVEVFKNPNGFKETLPSVVGFRKDRILVGEQARTFAEKDPKSVVSRFKRKMGTTESFKIASAGQSKTPVDLSAFVLKELKTFIHTGEVPEAVVITVPASFDMVQANATKEAGFAAGFRQVVLLQEPIAASLAYANKEKNLDLKNSQWIVYDLGGGTFDVALVRIVEGELKVIDHEGDNYLGGTDFDALIVERIVVPWLEKQGSFKDLLSQMKSESGKHNRLWLSSLNLAEQAKIQLSTKTSAEIAVSAEDDAGDAIEEDITITRSEYEALIREAVDGTAEMVKKILTRNSLQPQDVKFVLMVGGSTYTPFVRKRIEEVLGIRVNTGIDPTNAIAVGAAYFAGTKEINLGEKEVGKAVQPGTLRARVTYDRATQEEEVLFAARVEGPVEKLFYRITREDGGYDSGLKKLTARISEDLPLQKDAYNSFAFRVYDDRNSPVPTDVGSIQIAHGKYSVAGQMLPQDLCLVLDDPSTPGETVLHCLFAKNTVLPAKAKFSVEASKTIAHGSDDKVRIMVVEGPRDNPHNANKTVGNLVISGKHLKRDLVRGTDIELTFELSESRDLDVQGYILPSGPGFKGVYTSKNRGVNVEDLNAEVQKLVARLEQEQAEAIENENFEVAEELKTHRAPIKELLTILSNLPPDEQGDERYKLEDKKRQIAQSLGQLTSGKRLDRLRNDYQKAKKDAVDIVSANGNDLERRQLQEALAREPAFIHTAIPQKLEDAAKVLRRIEFQILRRTPAFLIECFKYLVGKRASFNDQLQAKNLIEAGKQHIATEDYDKLDGVITRLFSLLPDTDEHSDEAERYTGIWRT